MESVQQMVNVVMDHLGGTVNSRTVAGDHVQIGDATLVVLSMLSIGMGTGGAGGQGTDPKHKETPAGTGTGEGAGGGVKVRPVAVIAFTADGVQVLSIPQPPDAFDKFVDRVPGVVAVVEKARKTLYPD
jgi:uncharacterized spore protein YtfJ